ncbi:FkbM family methyltransferase [Butyrivibrio sp. AD3002]|uniref:FkbM family methyltransferase n=1 Tax=Butyrivibrio sp. AD3002 TaxID=1280670 RepID=UPI0003B4F619|nr:FkbM family methyltransferase [Butyrivibrio sp. AD3002]
MKKEIVETIKLSKELFKNIDNRIVPEGACQSLLACAGTINRELYWSEVIRLESGKVAPEDSVDTLREMVNVWNESLTKRTSRDLEARFWRLYDYFKLVDSDIIIANTKKTLGTKPKKLREAFEDLPRRYTFLTGKISDRDNDYSLITEYVNMMKSEIENFKWLFFRLEDNRSRMILIKIVEYWYSFDITRLGDLHETVFDEYFDLDILPDNKDEIFVDCGAYTGDSAMKFFYNYPEYKKIYVYEINQDTMQIMQENLGGLPNVIYRQCGVGKETGELHITGKGAGTKVTEEDTGMTARIVALDDDITEPVTMIKMDIEGAERDAIAGAKNHIKNEKPKLLICTYHLPSDIFRIPRMIDEIRDDYKMYLRFYGRGIWPTDHVLLTV